MILVSDFDGVWTAPDDEAAAQGAWMDRTLIEWSPLPAAATAGWISAARARVAREPQRFGWAPGGRLSAFGDEDPFAAHSGLLHLIHLDAPGDPVAAALRDAIVAHGQSLESFGGIAHAEGVKRVAATRGPGILPAAAAAGRRMLERGVQVEVVSNSGTQKLAEWFAHAGVPAEVHPASRPGALVLRGGARKFVLDERETRPLAVGGVTIDTARPHYEQVLREVRPDAVVGDVFSLDLALPLRLRREDPAFRGLRLFWLMQPYTPGWLRAQVQGAAVGEVELVGGGLASVASALAGTL